MTSVASGLAIRYINTYTIASFITIRCLIKSTDVCYLNKPVIIVGTGAGLSYANLGSTHHTIEDMAF